MVSDSELPRPARNLKLLASIQDIRDIELCSMADAGRILPTDNGLIVQVNASHPPPRQNFTTCHEISHTLIPNFFNGPRNRVDATTGHYEQDREEEYLCDVAAAEILMPLAHFRSAAESLSLSMDSLSYLASEFDASLEATALRWVGTGIADIAVIVWEMSWKPVEIKAMQAAPFAKVPPKKLRVRYARSGGRLADRFFPKSKSCDDNSLVVRAYRTGEVTRGLEKLHMGRGLEEFFMECQAFRLDGSSDGAKVISLVTLPR